MKQKPAYLLGIGEMHTHEHMMCAPSLTHVRRGRVRAARPTRWPGSGRRTSMSRSSTTASPSCRSSSSRSWASCKPGEGGAFFEGGHARIGGKLPVNTNGGMLSHAHAGAAGAILGIVEVVRQLRGGLGERQVQGAEVGLVHNEGGILSSHCTMILSQRQRLNGHETMQHTHRAASTSRTSRSARNWSRRRARSPAPTSSTSPACRATSTRSTRTTSTARPRRSASRSRTARWSTRSWAGCSTPAASTTARCSRCCGIDDWRLLSPVKHGDTIRMRSRVIEKKETSKPDRGVVTFERRMRQAGRHGGAGDADDACCTSAGRPS